MTQNQLEELEEWVESLEEPASYYDEEQDKDISLGGEPTVIEVSMALEATRTEVHLALVHVVEILQKLEKDMDKMRNHRHDASKQFGGRPEF